MKNVQISFDEQLLEEVDRFAANERMSRSAIVRVALKNWLREKEIRQFEEQWIKGLQENPDEAEAAEAWIRAQKWSD